MKGEKNTASITQAANTDLCPSPPVAVAQFRERGNYFNIRDTSPYTATLVPSLQLSPQESFYTSDTEERRKRSRAASASFPSHTTPALRFYLACTIREQAVPGMHPVLCLLPPNSQVLVLHQYFLFLSSPGSQAPFFITEHFDGSSHPLQFSTDDLSPAELPVPLRDRGTFCLPLTFCSLLT